MGDAGGRRLLPLRDLIVQPEEGQGVGSRMAEIRGENEVWLPGPGEDQALKKFKGET